ncbi:LysM peptidoglycan-binding domain-containing protein [Lacihabitans sp. LS3-19]|uniref:LysM peptidoglycan-binding domain-containing protein n=1 Tax=Lacihabitans sp. LS3-19 TaxID=2487335 RepID=UPI0020CEDA74|nr:LysM peptidoglycan-binding domain-containing protein [Lacihabitans sp. LS3-19]
MSNNLVYIIHKVEAGQTLYSLVNKYNCSVLEVSELNPSLKSGVGIKIGQTLKFPMIKNGKHVSAWAFYNAKKKSIEIPAQEFKTHIVKAGETIFSIAKLYDLDISYLVEANNISDNIIKIGGKLIVDKTELERRVKSNEKKTSPVLIVSPIGVRMQETGVAEVINTSNRTSKYLAMHRTAPVGSNIKITNEANGITIIARVVGNLGLVGPDENIMLKLSPYAFYKLRPKDTTLRATVEYYLPNAKKSSGLK